MKKVLFSVLMISAMLILSSCGGNTKSANESDEVATNEILPADPPITYKNVGIDGVEDIPIDGCFEVQKVSASVVSGEELVTDAHISVTMKIKKVKALPEKPDENSYYYNQVNFELIDENETVIAETKYFAPKSILDLSEGNVEVITSKTKENRKTDVEKLFSKVKYIRLAGLNATKPRQTE